MSERHRTEAQGNALYRLVRRDIGRKLIALVLAITAWILVGSALRTQKVLKFEVVPMDSEPLAGAERVNKIYIVRGPDQILDPEESIFAEVTLIGNQAALEGDWHVSDTYSVPEGFPSQSNYKNLTIDNAFVEERMAPSALPTPDVRLAMDQPVILTVRKAKTTRISLNPVDNLEVRGAGAAGITEIAEQVKLEPSTVTIRGPEDEIEEIERKPSLLKLTPLVIDEPNPEGLEFSLKVDRSQQQLRLVRLEGPPVTAKIALAAVQPVTKTLLGIRIEPVGTDWVVDQFGALERLQPDRDSEAWLCDVVVSAPSSTWETVSIESLRDRILLYVFLPQLGAATNQAFLPVFWSTHGDADGLTWPKDVKVERLNTDQIHLWIAPSEDNELDKDGG